MDLMPLMAFRDCKLKIKTCSSQAAVGANGNQPASAPLPDQVPKNPFAMEALIRHNLEKRNKISSSSTQQHLSPRNTHRPKNPEMRSSPSGASASNDQTVNTSKDWREMSYERPPDLSAIMENALQMGSESCMDGQFTIRNKERMIEEVDPLAIEYLECVNGDYRADRLDLAIELGSQLVRKLGAFYLASRHVQELKMRELNSTRARVEEKAYLFPAVADALREALRLGVIPPFGEIVTAEQRQRGLPHDKKLTRATVESLWSDVRHGCVMLCRTDVIKREERVEPTPTGMVVKKNPDRTISNKMRMISDLRRINLATSAKRMYPMMVLTIQRLCGKIERLKRAYPQVPIMMTKRDISRAFKWVRLHPDMSSILMHEFAKEDAGATSDFYDAFLVLPFGFVGSPGYFCMFTDVIQALHRSFPPADKSWSTEMIYEAEMFVGDAMFIEPSLGARLSESVRSWEWACMFLLGEKKLEFGQTRRGRNMADQTNANWLRSGYCCIHDRVAQG